MTKTLKSLNLSATRTRKIQAHIDGMVRDAREQATGPYAWSLQDRVEYWRMNARFLDLAQDIMYTRGQGHFADEDAPGVREVAAYMERKVVGRLKRCKAWAA